MKGAHSAEADRSATTRAEIVEVGSGFETPLPEFPTKQKSRWTLLRAGALTALVVAGLALVPGNEQAPSTVTDGETLREPVVASSTIPALPQVVSVVTDETFSLIPVADLNGYARLIGPVEFDGRFWVAGTPPWANHAVILSSEDGNRWAVESELVGPDELLRIEDLAVFRSRLVAIGTSSNSRPTPQTDFAQTLLSWTSADGRSWFLQMLPELEGVAYWGVQAVTGADQIMVMAGVYEVYGELMYPAIPAEFGPGLAAGQLFAGGERRSDSLRVVVSVAPGIELFTTEVPVSGDQLMYPTRLYGSEDLAVWRAVDPSDVAGWDLTWSEDHGFILHSMSGGLVTSPDGREWQSSDLPTASFMPWHNGLIAVVGDGGAPDLMIVEEGVATRIGLPKEMEIGRNGAGYPWIQVGPTGLIASITAYEYTSEQLTVTSGSLTLRWDGQLLLIREDGEVRARIPIGTPSGTATYDSQTNAISFPTVEGNGTVEVPLDDLAKFWSSPVPMHEGRTDLYQTRDGLVWSKAESALLSDSVTLIGGVGDGFLVGIGGDTIHGQNEAMTVFRTGPID